MSGTRLAALVGALIVAAVLARMVPASPDTDTYRDSAHVTLGTAASEVATVQQVVRLLGEDKLLSASAVVQLRESEEALDSATSKFNTLNPPVGSDDLANRVGTLLQQAGDLLEQARIAVHRNAVGQYAGLDQRLGKLAQDLESLEARS